MRRAWAWGAAFVVGVFAPLFLAAKDTIQQYDPAQYAEVARRMFESGDWAHLRDAFGPYLDKPPLTFWLINGGFWLFGETSFAVRLPVLILGATLLFFTFRIGALLWDQRTGLMAAAFVGSSIAFLIMIADPKVDMAVTTFITGAVYFFLRAVRRPNEQWPAYAGWISVALGMLSKGPIALCAPLLAVGPELVRRRESGATVWQRLARLRPITGLALTAVLLAPWYRENIRQFGSNGPLFLLWHQSFGRIFERTYRNDASPLFFLHTSLWAFMPFIAILIAELMRRLWSWGSRGWTLPQMDERVPLWWLILPLVAISSSSYKLPQYLYWLTPPAALLSARALARWAWANEERTLRILRRVQLAIAALVIALSAIILAICFPAGGVASSVWIGLLGAAAAVAWFGFRNLSSDWRLAALAIIPFIAFNAFFELHVHPSLLRYQPYEELGTLVRNLDPPGKVLRFCGIDATNAAAFYARREVAQVELDDLRRGEGQLVVVRNDLLPRFQKLGLRPESIWTGEVFPTSRPSGAFLRAYTRSAVVTPISLVRLLPAAEASAARQ